MPNSLRDAIGGGLLGVAVGDALGSTVEFMKPEEIQRLHGVHTEMVGGGAFGWEPGQGTDDTSLTWAVLRGYLKPGVQYEANVIPSIAAAFLEWYETDPRDIGTTTAKALARLRRECDPKSSGVQGEWARSNGSLMRCLPTGLLRPNEFVRRSESADISFITHAEPLCLHSCVAYNDIAALLLEGQPPARAVSWPMGRHKLHIQVQEALSVAPDIPVEALSTSGYVIDSLRCAVWAIQQEGSFEDVLVALVNRGDDADTTGAVAGGLLGILHGASAIPERWRNHLEYGPRFVEAAGRIEAMRKTPPASLFSWATT